VEVLVISVWFCALIAVGTAFAATLIIRAVRADNRYLALYEPPVESAVGQQEQEDLLLAA
jgi:hypothetical protein